ncbi:hypothetical protein PHYSODRAFT_307793 [Phytophthora sojae]|uniref:Uncharacterized protein n=1 Tax=Phytophthora sojae (strain P6497) TaxID=1094619 RepID=G5AG33_PHYSP|nr:hypothetical protein PHYSODRAFT_307793 [Phytophthora sojae]EGZ05545.1 hypothetical protein PHYSODRAFT_307793 [Phytophthora sojae]|eukprot:XP_009539076.1 hypothetical protein PHYSODRAFT_307793 [Phytophthora sojae]
MGFDEQAGMERVPYLPDDWTGPGNAVTWGGHSMLYAVENKHVDVAIWLHERSAHGLATDNNDKEEAGRIIQAALATGFIELSAKIMARYNDNWDDWMLEYSLDYPLPRCIEVMLEKRYFQVFEQSGRRAMLSLARTGHLKLLQRVLQVYDPIPTDDQNWKYNWLSALTDACKNGHLPVIQFMMEQGNGAQATGVRTRTPSQGITDLKDEALKIMARLVKLPLVQWVVEHVISTPKGSIRPILHAAASTGQVEILRYLLDLDPSRAPGFKFDPVYPGVMESAAFFGQLDTDQWLFAHGFKCSRNTMEHAACARHLDIVKWIHAHAKVECTTEIMDSTAGSGQLDVVKWLYKNQPNGCSPKGFDDAVEFSHARVAFLLHGQFPNHIPVGGRLPSIADNFDMLLFLYDHYPTIFTAKAVAKARYRAVNLCTKTSSSEIRSWLGKLETTLSLEVAERSLESLRTDNGKE